MAERGRPTDYRPEFVEQAVRLAELGATDEEIADFFDVSVRTLYRWRNAHEDFCQALKAGKEPADARVERSLFERSTGYRYVEQQAIKVKVSQYEERVEIVEVERFAPPETTAMIFWLKNRRTGAWRDRQEHEHNVGEALADFLKALDGGTRGIPQGS